MAEMKMSGNYHYSHESGAYTYVKKTGYLVKSPSGGKLGRWRRRWCKLVDLMKPEVLTGTPTRRVMLEYYARSPKAFNGKSMEQKKKGSLDLHSCIAVVSHDKKIKGHTFVLNIIIGRGSTARIHHLATTSNEERNEWITALNEFIFTMPVFSQKYFGRGRTLSNSIYMDFLGSGYYSKGNLMEQPSTAALTHEAATGIPPAAPQASNTSTPHSVAQAVLLRDQQDKEPNETPTYSGQFVESDAYWNDTVALDRHRPVYLRLSYSHSMCRSNSFSDAIQENVCHFKLPKVDGACLNTRWSLSSADDEDDKYDDTATFGIDGGDTGGSGGDTGGGGGGTGDCGGGDSDGGNVVCCTADSSCITYVENLAYNRSSEFESPLPERGTSEQSESGVGAPDRVLGVQSDLDTPESDYYNMQISLEAQEDPAKSKTPALSEEVNNDRCEAHREDTDYCNIPTADTCEKVAHSWHSEVTKAPSDQSDTDPYYESIKDAVCEFVDGTSKVSNVTDLEKQHNYSNLPLLENPSHPTCPPLNVTHRKPQEVLPERENAQLHVDGGAEDVIYGNMIAWDLGEEDEEAVYYNASILSTSSDNTSSKLFRNATAPAKRKAVHIAQNSTSGVGKELQGESLPCRTPKSITNPSKVSPQKERISKSSKSSSARKLSHEDDRLQNDSTDHKISPADRPPRYDPSVRKTSLPSNKIKMPSSILKWELQNKGSKLSAPPPVSPKPKLGSYKSSGDVVRSVATSPAHMQSIVKSKLTKVLSAPVNKRKSPKVKREGGTLQSNLQSHQTHQVKRSAAAQLRLASPSSNATPPPSPPPKKPLLPAHLIQNRSPSPTLHINNNRTQS